MQEINRLIGVVEILRKSIRKDMPSQQIALLLTVAENPGVSMPDLCEMLDMPQGTLSRNVKALSSYVDRSGRIAEVRGQGLLFTEQCRANRHALAVFLTEKGLALIDELAEAIRTDSKPQKCSIPNDASYAASAGAV